MPAPPRNHNKRDFPGRRWLSVSVRSLHLVGVVLLGIALLGSGDPNTAGQMVLATGLSLYGMDLWCNPKHFGELAGVFILLKLLLVGAILAFPAAAVPLFWALVVTSSLVSHAPRPFRHIRVFN